MTQAIENTQFEFFVVVTPGFEVLAERELRRWLGPDVLCVRERGGLTLRLPLLVGFSLNRCLKIPTRVLLRLAIFGCSDFPKLFKKMAGFDWSPWLETGTAVEFTASSQKSRLAIKKRIEETCVDGLKRWQRDHGATSSLAAGEPLSILVRIDDDVCTMSLDTSGELLHKRGAKTLSSEAPVRETIAAAMLEWMVESAEGAMSPGAAEVTRVTLIDPMVGSGTFALEAAALDQLVTTRRFAFEDLPIVVRPEAFTKLPAPALRRDSGATAVAASAFAGAVSSAKNARVEFTSFVGHDIDEHAVESTRRNWSALVNARVSQQDLFDVKSSAQTAGEVKPPSAHEQRWLVTNPPYGERIKIEGRLKDYYELMFETCERTYLPDMACFLLPDTANPERLRLPQKWKSPRYLKFQNGGLPVTALLCSRER